MRTTRGSALISRRGLLFGVLAALGLAALRLGLSTPESAVGMVLRKRLSYLKLDDVGVTAFAADYTAAGKMARGKLRLVAAMAPFYYWLPASDDTPDAVRHGEERIVTAYLLSSDFFINGADDSRPVGYVGLFDPWTKLSACQNLFARLDIAAIGSIGEAAAPLHS